MATVRNGKTTGRLYKGPNTVEEPPLEPEIQHGNVNQSPLRSIYKHWSAAYRGFVPHGIRLPSPEKGVIEQFDDNPETFAEDKLEVPPGMLLVEPYDQSYYTCYTMTIGMVPQMIVAYERKRFKLRLYNRGAGAIWIGQNESVQRDGFPLITATQPLEMETTREVWAVSDASAQVSILNEYIKEVG